MMLGHGHHNVRGALLIVERPAHRRGAQALPARTFVHETARNIEMVDVQATPRRLPPCVRRWRWRCAGSSRSPARRASWCSAKCAAPPRHAGRGSGQSPGEPSAATYACAATAPALRWPVLPALERCPCRSPILSARKARPARPAHRPEPRQHPRPFQERRERRGP